LLQPNYVATENIAIKSDLIIYLKKTSKHNIVKKVRL